MTRFAPFVPFLFLVACATSDADLPAGQHIGEQLEPRATMALAEVHAQPEKHFEQTLWVEGTVKAVCQSAGCWMQIEDGEKTSMVRWETGCGGKYAFPKDAVGERILIQGSFYPKEISKEDVEHLEAEAGGALQVPEKTYEMNASAVVLLDRGR